MRIRTLTCLLCLALLASCAPSEESGEISANSTPAEIAAHLLAVRASGEKTMGLTEHLPELSLAQAMAIQDLTLAAEAGKDGRPIGYKMGGTKMANMDDTPAPIWGYSLKSQHFENGSSIPASMFAGASTMVEAEIAFVMKDDLPGPVVTREQLLAALKGVYASAELLSLRLLTKEGPPPLPPTTAHVIADNVSHGAAIIGGDGVAAAEVDFDNECATAYVNGDSAAYGCGAAIMGKSGNPLDALLWLANDLPKRGQYLRAGDYVVTGSLWLNPEIKAGDSVELRFKTLGTVRLRLE